MVVTVASLNLEDTFMQDKFFNKTYTLFFHEMKGANVQTIHIHHTYSTLHSST